MIVYTGQVKIIIVIVENCCLPNHLLADTHLPIGIQDLFCCVNAHQLCLFHLSCRDPSTNWLFFFHGSDDTLVLYSKVQAVEEVSGHDKFQYTYCGD